jgi:uncharacterized membrane protein
MTVAGAARAPDASGGARPRFALVDAVRGVAIIGVVVYHFFWDLSYLWLIPVDVSTQPVWVAFARTLLGSFVFLVGVGLVLAHGTGIRWRAFWRRLAIIGGAALLVTAGTLVAFPETFVYFGVLHAIALFSVLGLAFLRVPVWLVFALAALFIAAPLAYSAPMFSERIWSWIGFWPVPPPTNDLVPIFPWFGLTLAGIGIARVVLAGGWAERIGMWRAEGRFSRLLVAAGRWSLVIYLVHQPLLLAVLYPAANTMFTQTASTNSFNRTCQIGCTDTGASDAYCTTYCACARDEVEARGLWEAVETMTPTAEQTEAVNGVVLVCSAEVPPDTALE